MEATGDMQRMHVNELIRAVIVVSAVCSFIASGVRRRV